MSKSKDIIIQYQIIIHVNMNKIIPITLLLLCLSVPIVTEQQQQPSDFDQQQIQQLSMKRTACLVLSRYHSNGQKQLIEQIVGSLSPNDQQKFINKMYAIAVQTCMPKISIEEAQQFFVQQAQFDPASMFYLLDGMDYVGVANDVETLTPNQKNIIKFMKNFDEEMAVKREEREAEKDVTSEEDQITLFGVPIAKFNSIGGYVYIIVLLGAVVGGLIWGFTQINNSSLPKNKKKSSKSKSPKKQ